MNVKERLIVALDVDDFGKAEELIDILSPEVDIFKVGIAPFTSFGQELLDKLNDAGKKVFLDLKVHDIPNTAANAARSAARKGVFMMNFHCLGGRKMMSAAVKAVDEISAADKTVVKPILLGVTVLTSAGEEDLRAAGFSGTVREKVLELAADARGAGFDGVVASAEEAGEIKRKIGKSFIVVTPGIRLEGDDAGDQKRVLTPKRAMAEGADYIVVGRPIIGAKDPVAAAGRILRQMEESLPAEV
ncbi:MAG: orotidine-5'-phosphate decarboxylase [Candidatus Omnitrophota bacterium]